jgi:hypothetical protein
VAEAGLLATLPSRRKELLRPDLTCPEETVQPKYLILFYTSKPVRKRLASLSIFAKMSIKESRS